MKVQLKVSPNAIIEVEGDKHTDLFQNLSTMQEVFGERQCGCCGCQEINFIARNVGGNWFYEMKCQKCYAVLQFGASKTAGNLYPKKKWNALSEKEKERRAAQEDLCTAVGYLPDGGWWKYKGQDS